MVKNKITIVGAGNGGVTAAYHIAKLGHEVCLYDTPKFDKQIKILQQHNNEIVAVNDLYECPMKFPGTEKISVVTTDAKTAAEFSKYILFICPSFAQELLFNELLPYLKDGQVIILMPGNYGSLVLRHNLNNDPKHKDLKLSFVDAISIPWATRLVEDNKIAILGIKEFIPVSIWPKHEIKEIEKWLDETLPIKAKILPNPIVAGLENINFGGHPLMTVCNIGLLENFDGKYNYYKDCCSTATANACNQMDIERLSVGKAYGWKLETELDAMNSLYASNEKSVYDFNRNSETHVKLQSAPNSSKHRYVTEDVPYLLVPCFELAKNAGIDVKVVESIIHIASAYNNENYFEKGRTLEKMGLKGKSVSEIVKLMEQ